MTDTKSVKNKTPELLRSARWFAPDDVRSFGHRSRVMQRGYAPEDWVGKPVIAIEVLKGRSIIGLYPSTEQQAKDDFAAWRKARNR